MKNTLAKISILALLIFAPYFKATEAKAGILGGLFGQSTEETRTGTVIQVSLGLFFLDVALVVDSETGEIYLSEGTRLDIQTGDTVSYSTSTKSTRIIIRSVIRK